MNTPIDKQEFIPTFVNNLLYGNNGTQIPRGAQWVVFFHDLANSIVPSFELALKYEPNKWGVGSVKERAYKLLTNELQSSVGCLFAQAISLPGESFAPAPGGNISYNSFIKPYVGAGRDNFPILNMSFLETVSSFTDYVLRPWTIATEAFGMFAWPKKDVRNYRTTLECWKIDNNPPDSSGIAHIKAKKESFNSNVVSGAEYGEKNYGPIPETRTENGTKPRISTKITFHDICCVGVGDEEYNYTPVTSPMLRSARFAYNSYTVDFNAGKA